MKQEIQEIIEIASRICEKLDKMQEQDAIFHSEIGSYFENASWEIYRMQNDLKHIAGRYF